MDSVSRGECSIHSAQPNNFTSFPGSRGRLLPVFQPSRRASRFEQLDADPELFGAPPKPLSAVERRPQQRPLRRNIPETGKLSESEFRESDEFVDTRKVQSKF